MITEVASVRPASRGTARCRSLLDAVLIPGVLLMLFVSNGGVALAKNTDSQYLIEGVELYQVFPRKGAVGTIPFTVKVSGPLSAQVVRTSDGVVVTSETWSAPECEPGKSLAIKGVPVGGEYTIRFRAASGEQQVEHVLVGDIWIVGGQSNAVGTENIPPDPVPEVHFFKGDRWQQGRDPLFNPIFPIPGGKTYVSAWQRAAKEYHRRTGIPVGIMGWAFGGVPIARFWKWESREMPDFKDLVSKHGKDATCFMFYQGESDANPESLPFYKERLKAMGPTIRSYASNPDLVFVVIQLSYFSDPPGRETPYYGRLREIERQVCVEDPRAVLIPALPYPHVDVVHLTLEGYGGLARRIGECMADIAKTGKVRWQGPRAVKAQFTDAGRKQIRVTFDSADELRIPEEPLGVPAPPSPRSPGKDWYVTDSDHLGYAEITSSSIRDGKLTVNVAGTVLETDAAQLTADAVAIPLQRTGYIQPSTVTVDGMSIVLDLPEAAQSDAKVSYGLMTNSLCTLVDGQGRPAATFADMPVK